MSEPVRVGIIGTGFIGTVHARAVRAVGGDLLGVAERDPDAAKESAVRLGAQRAFSSAQELIDAPDIDVVHICTPNFLHAEIASQAIAAGKHVVCEKPLATNAATCSSLAQQADAAGVVTAVPFVYRYYPTVREARQRVCDGRVGDLRLLHGSYLQDWLASADDDNWRVDPTLGGASRAFGDIGVHWCDLVEFTTGHRITAVSARTLTAHPDRAGTPGVGTEDVAVVSFETDHGAVGNVVVSQVTHGRKNRLWFSLDGSEASLSFDQEQPESLWVGGREQNVIVLRGSGGMSGAATAYDTTPAGHPQGYQDCFNAFVAETHQAVRGNRIEGLPTFADGVRAAHITESVLRSAAERAWVTVAA